MYGILYYGLFWRSEIYLADVILRFFCILFCRARVCRGHSFVYVAHFVFLRDVWIRTQRAAAASRRATNLATHLPKIFLIVNVNVHFLWIFVRMSLCEDDYAIAHA